MLEHDIQRIKVDQITGTGTSGGTGVITVIGTRASDHRALVTSIIASNQSTSFSQIDIMSGNNKLLVVPVPKEGGATIAGLEVNPLVCNLGEAIQYQQHSDFTASEVTVSIIALDVKG